MIKQLVYGRGVKNQNNNDVIFGNMRLRENQQIANKFNEYFVNSIYEIRNSIVSDRDTEFNCDIDTQVNIDKFQKITAHELRYIMKNMNKNKKGTSEGISTKILQKVVNAFEKEFIHIINTSLSLGEFPSKWKTSQIVPIPKIQNTNKCENFRPINVLPTYEKVLETVVKMQIYKYFEENKLLAQCQSGFRNGYSCETALQYTISDWKQDCDNNKYIVVVFIELRRAFETVDRELLLKKLL